MPVQLAREKFSGRGRGRLAAAVVTVAVTAAGCGGSVREQRTHSRPGRTNPPARTQTTTASVPMGPSIGGCNYAVPHARLVRFRARSEQLRAAVAGTGATGVILANQTDNNACEWLPFPA